MSWWIRRGTLKKWLQLLIMKILITKEHFRNLVLATPTAGAVGGLITRLILLQIMFEFFVEIYYDDNS
ncbi:hypothetical protein XO10_05880 [Marinitoga sp. 1135]|nr:hypothetical protein [Marinitoga sp. 1135]